MTLYEITVDDYGHGDCRHAIVRAKSEERALEMIKEAGFRLEHDETPRVLDKYNKITEEIVRVI